MFGNGFFFSPIARAIPFANALFTSKNVYSAIVEAKQYAEGFPRAGMSRFYNGIVSGNDWLGPSELGPNTPFLNLPVKTKLNEISWSNQTANVDFDIQFRTGSKTGTIFYTLQVRASNPGYGYVSGLTNEFAAGTTIWAQYVDQGQNVSDFELCLWISRIP